MNRDEFYSSLYLAHHGIKGQKWGVRRYQNEDGSYTDEGAKRRRSDNKPGMSDGAKKALKVGAVVAGTALAAIGAYKLHQYMNSPLKSIPTFGLKYDKEGNIDALNPLASNWHVPKTKSTSVTKGLLSSSPRLDFVKSELKEKYGSKVEDLQKKAKEGVTNTIRDAGKAAAAAAITAVGTIAVNKAASHFRDKEGDSDEVKNTKLIGKEAVSAAIRKASNTAAGKVSYGSSSNGVSNGGGFSREKLDSIIAEVGKPHQVHSWGDQSVINRYQNVMMRYQGKDQDKQDIRSMKKGGFDIDQIEKKYLK